MRIRESIFKKQARNLDISIAVLEGATLKEVGEQHGITGPRVGAILSGTIFDCRRRYKNAKGVSPKTEVSSGYLKDLREHKDKLIPFLKKWGKTITSEDVWQMDIPLINKIFWDIPNKRICASERKVAEVLVRAYPEDIFQLLNGLFDEHGWQITLTYADRLFTETEGPEEAPA